MRIVHFIYDHPKNPWLGGGGAIRAWEVNKFLTEHGHSVTWICGGFPNCPEGEISEGGTFLFTGESGSYLKSRLSFSLRARRVFQKYLAHNQPPDLVVEDISAFSYPLPELVWKGAMVSIIHHYLSWLNFRKLGPLGLFTYFGERRHFKRCRYCVTVSEASRENIRRLNPKAQVEIVYNGIDSFSKDVAAVSPVPGRIGFLGRLDIYNKGLDILLEALKIVFAQIPQSHAVFIGGGKDELKLKKIAEKLCIAERVSFTGRLKEGEERFAEAQKCELLCMPSRYEGWGIVALELAALGRPVIASDIPGLREAVRHNQTGLLVPPSAAAFAEHICELLQNPAERKRLGENAKRWAGEFGWEQCAKRQLDFYERALL